jgi:hypothetical protein
MGLAEIALGAGRASATGGRSVVDIVTFIEAPWGLNMRLFPIQKVILKTYYGLPLEDRVPNLTFTDWRRTTERTMTEADYLRMLNDEGRCNIREVEPGRERREMVLSIGRRAGKCVVGDTLVLTDGGIRRIDEMGDVDGPEFQPLDVGVVQEGGRRSRAAYFYNGGVQATFRVRTVGGTVVEGTWKHRVKVLRPDGIIEWCRLDEVAPGTPLCVALGSNLWGSDPFDAGVAFDMGVRGDDAVPGAVLRAGAEPVRAYLRGFIPPRRHGDYVRFGSMDHARTVRVILLNFGIQCTVSPAGHGAWLTVSPCCGAAFDALLSDGPFAPRPASYTYEAVVSVEAGRAPVYDLNVPDGASFVANGLVNHNTTMSACIAAYETYRLINKGDPQGYYGLPASNNIQLISVATDKDQAGLLYQEVSGHFRNCFAAETEIVTADGVKPIGSLAGTVQTVLAGNGAWVDAPIRSFGRQQLYKLTLTRQGVEKVIHATANHRWFARDARKAHRGQGFREFTTAELRPGKHHLQSIFGPSYKNRIDPSPFGVAHGFTFGDGCTVKGERNANTAMMIGEKDAHLRPYFALCPLREVPGVNGVEASALPNFFRELPSIRENKAYLLGWLQGYFAADGSVSNGNVVISSAKREHVEFVRDVCAVLGIGTYDIRADERISNLTGRPHTIYKMALMRGTLDESFFVIPAHRESFIAAGGSDVQRSTVAWTVKSVEPTDRHEDVYCATVDGIGSFALSGNILTGNCAFFMPYTANNTQSYARFQSPKDIERYGSYRMDPTAKATLKVTFRSCVAKGLRGAGNIVIILDEVAHFTDDGQSSADAVYNAVVPSSAAFSRKDPNDPRVPIGGVESKVISISSPLGRQGLFYKLFDTGFQSAKISEERLCIQAPTWEVNPTVPAGFFEAEYVKDARVFFTEYGAEFSDRTRGWIEDSADLLACVDPVARPRTRAQPRQPHVAGIDVALVGDYSTIAIGHIDEQQRIVVDLVEGIRAGEGEYEDCDRLEFTDVAEWIYDFSKRFYITDGLFDQWLGIPLEQALVAKGLRQFKSFKSTPQLNSQMFQNFKDMMFDRRMVLYDWPIPPGETHCLYINELLELQAQYKSKYVTIVEAPNVSGKHDDHADALVRMVWAASQHMGKHATIAGHRSIPGQRPAPPAYALRKKALLSGSHPDRMVPKGVGPARFMGADAAPRAMGRGPGRGPGRIEALITPPWRKGGR